MYNKPFSVYHEAQNYMLLIAGPYLVDGKYGSAIHTPNDATNCGNMISLDNHDNDCLGNINLCSDGITLSFWFKGSEQPHNYVFVLLSSNFMIGFNGTGNQLFPLYHLNGQSVGQRNEPGQSSFSLNEWHNIGITYSVSSGFNVYHDGCLQNIAFQSVNASSPFTKVSLSGLTCFLTCANMTYDDLRVYNVKKDERFMYWLWKN